MRSRIAASLEAVGALCAALAGFSVNMTAGLALAAVGLVLFGLALEREG